MNPDILPTPLQVTQEPRPSPPPQNSAAALPPLPGGAGGPTPLPTCCKTHVPQMVPATDHRRALRLPPRSFPQPSREQDPGTSYPMPTLTPGTTQPAPPPKRPREPRRAPCPSRPPGTRPSCLNTIPQRVGTPRPTRATSARPTSARPISAPPNQGRPRALGPAPPAPRWPSPARPRHSRAQLPALRQSPAAMGTTEREPGVEPPARTEAERGCDLVKPRPPCHALPGGRWGGAGAAAPHLRAASRVAALGARLGLTEGVGRGPARAAPSPKGEAVAAGGALEPQPCASSPTPGGRSAVPGRPNSRHRRGYRKWRVNAAPATVARAGSRESAEGGGARPLVGRAGAGPRRQRRRAAPPSLRARGHGQDGGVCGGTAAPGAAGRPPRPPPAAGPRRPAPATAAQGVPPLRARRHTGSGAAAERGAPKEGLGGKGARPPQGKRQAPGRVGGEERCGEVMRGDSPRPWRVGGPAAAGRAPALPGCPCLAGDGAGRAEPGAG